MKLYLFGGHERKLNQFKPLYRLIAGQIQKIKAKQVLHLPFAFQRMSFTERHQQIKSFFISEAGLNLEFLNAADDKDLPQVKVPVVFISGGQSNKQLLSEIKKRPLLLKLIQETDHFIGESAGAMVAGEYARTATEPYELIEGLGILKSTIIEPHYTERDGYQLLLDEMGKINAKYGIGIDCVTGIVFDLRDFPCKYKKIGEGLVEIKRKSI